MAVFGTKIDGLELELVGAVLEVVVVGVVVVVVGVVVDVAGVVVVNGVAWVVPVDVLGVPS